MLLHTIQIKYVCKYLWNFLHIFFMWYPDVVLPDRSPTPSKFVSFSKILVMIMNSGINITLIFLKTISWLTHNQKKAVSVVGSPAPLLKWYPPWPAKVMYPPSSQRLEIFNYNDRISTKFHTQILSNCTIL